jgi:type VI protein secretion system component VasA
MTLRPGDSCLAPPRYISSEPVAAIFRGPAQPIEINEIGHGHQLIPQVYVEYDGEVHAVEAEAIKPIGSAS